MAMRCMNCNKGVMYGHNVSHAKNRTQKIFRPNLHAVRINVGTTMKKMKLCTKCLRMVKKATGQKKDIVKPATVSTVPLDTVVPEAA